MSSNTNETWVYQISGRSINLYQYVYSANTDTLANYRIRLPDSYFGSQLIYPDEDIASGLRIEGTAFISPFVKESLEDTISTASGTDISFALSGTRITSDNTNNFWDTTSGFAAGDKIRVIGSASNDADYTIDSFGGSGNSNMVVSGSTLTDENTGESVTINQIPKEDSSPSETSHVNLSRLLCLAVVDYVKAQVAEISGSVDLKEYYMKEFWKKIGDDESNKLKHSITFASSVYSVV